MLRLVPFGPEHFPLLAQWFATQAEIVQWGGPLLSFPLTVQQLGAMLAEADSVPPSRLCWMVACKDALVGHAQLGFDWRNGSARLSRVAVAPHARGQGLAGPMLRLIVNEAFARPGIERVELSVYTWNMPAIRTYEKLGFKAEGTRRSSALVDGVRWDAAIMGLLRQEWATPETRNDDLDDPTRTSPGDP
ncbi:GNAT family N-acetyltransferase [Gluconacetobacter sp. Hr-1-5]|uniref:GNAT family N-acetyltransferase n=1 Tax=Gluconacetobacter sp. Hr-1-5 TaxID=3395370 RepID=UPI003B51FF3A